MRIDRRSLLRTTAALVAAASLPTPALTQNKRMLALLDPSLTQHELESVRSIGGAGARMIEPDLVRQWRDGLGTQVAVAAGAMAYVRWDKALLLSGLARESGMSTRHRPLGRSCFEVKITRVQSGGRRNTNACDASGKPSIIPLIDTTPAIRSHLIL